MNSQTSFRTTCLTALLLVACTPAAAEQGTATPPQQAAVELQAAAVPGTVAPEPAVAGSGTGDAAQSAAAGGGEAQASVPGIPADPDSGGEPGFDAAADAGLPDEPEATPAPVPAIDPGSLYGQWTVREQHPEAGEVVTLFSINSDSSFAGTMTVAGNVVWQYSGNWYLDGNLITWFYTQSTPPLMLVDETEVDEIINVDSEKLVYRSGKRDVLETLYRVN